MNGEPIRGRGRARRRRRSPTSRSASPTGPAARPWSLLPLAAWLVAAALVALAFRGRAARAALALSRLACAWAPLMLLVGGRARRRRDRLGADVGRRGAGPRRAHRVASCRAPRGSRWPARHRRRPRDRRDRGLAATRRSRCSGPTPAAACASSGSATSSRRSLTTLTLIGAGAWLSTRRESERPRRRGLVPRHRRPGDAGVRAGPLRRRRRRRDRARRSAAPRPRRWPRASSAGARSRSCWAGAARSLAALFLVDSRSAAALTSAGPCSAPARPATSRTSSSAGSP